MSPRCGQVEVGAAPAALDPRTMDRGSHARAQTLGPLSTRPGRWTSESRDLNSGPSGSLAGTWGRQGRAGHRGPPCRDDGRHTARGLSNRLNTPWPGVCRHHQMWATLPPWIPSHADNKAGCNRRAGGRCSAEARGSSPVGPVSVGSVAGTAVAGVFRAHVPGAASRPPFRFLLLTRRCCSPLPRRLSKGPQRGGGGTEGYQGCPGSWQACPQGRNTAFSQGLYAPGTPVC